MDGDARAQAWKALQGDERLAGEVKRFMGAVEPLNDVVVLGMSQLEGADAA